MYSHLPSSSSRSKMKMTSSFKLTALTLATITITIQQACGLQIGPLLSTCIDACERGCIAIRNVQASRIADTNCDNGSEGSDDSNRGLKFELKDSDDPRSALTEADNAAQLAIVASLRLTWDNNDNDDNNNDSSSSMFWIVGEEDENTDESEIMAFINDKNNKPLKKTTFDDELGEGTADIDPSSITVFVDPLREVDEEQFEDDPAEFILSDLEESDSESRRKSYKICKM